MTSVVGNATMEVVHKLRASSMEFPRVCFCITYVGGGLRSDVVVFVFSTSPPSPVTLKEPHGAVVIEFEEQGQGNTKVLISQQDGDSRIAVAAADISSDRNPDEDGGDKASFSSLKQFFTECEEKVETALKKTKNMVSSKAYEVEELAKEAMDEAVEKVGDGAGKLSENLPNGVKSVGEFAGNSLSHGVSSVGKKGKEVAGNAKAAVNEALGDRIVAVLKDSVVKVENWDPVDSPKRIGEDIERNVSRKVEQGVDEVKETLKNVQETRLDELLRRSKKLVRDVFLMFSLEKTKAVISWCHLLGFSMAYGMGVWFTFVSSCVLGKCLPKRESSEMVMNKVYMVYFRAMAYCVGGALIGYVVSQGRKGILVWNKMEMFQGFNLVCALFMILINLIFLEPQATKLMMERNKIKEKDRKKVGENSEKESRWNEKLMKLNAYSSTLNVSTLVVLTWHLAYIGQLLQTRDD
ncbi:hypothetical protein L6452_33778 [Arctium lappa]|uniref:Uncharacterized protein n=1 Tax=Arctium lappa TaxID=4217 RepID=A0ACB8YFN3_ARCLA|nr:hypothetical protein L6452_33778 [Arctium lappa]